MTRLATISRLCVAAHMLSMVKLHIEILVEARWEIFQWRFAAAYIRVTDLAHRHCRPNKLREMAVSTILVSRELRRVRIIRSRMTVGATKRSMTLTGM